MVIDDPIYGKFDVTEDVIIELLQDPTVLRLKSIKQGGTTAYINGYEEYSRFDHSVGVMLLVKHLGASLKEQVAALIHDISHTAFSHIIDFVYKSHGKQNYHEQIKEKFLQDSNIPPILQKYNIDLRDVIDEQKFSLIEKELPDLCADRVDYALRCLYFYQKKHEAVKKYFNSFVNYHNEIIMNNEETAVAFAKDFFDLETNIYTKPRNVAAYFIMAEAIRKALSKHIIAEEDFLSSDDQLLYTLKAAKDEEITQLLSLVNANLQVEESTDNFDYELKTKVRYINPKFLHNGKILSVLEVDKNLANEIEEHKRQMSQPKYVKIKK